MTPTSTRRWKTLTTIAYCLLFAAVGLYFSALGPTLPGLAENTRSALSEISFLFVARGIGSMIGSVLGGRLLDRIPGHRLVAAALVLSMLTVALTPLMGTLWALTMVLLVMGFMQGTLNVAGNTLLIWLYGNDVAPYMNFLHFCYGVGTFVSPLVIAQTLQLENGLQWSYWILALLILPATLMPLFLRSPQHARLSPQADTRPASFSLVVLLTLVFFGYAAASYSFGGWVFTYATRLGLADESAGAYLTSLYWGALTMGRLVSVPFAARVAPAKMLLFDLAGALLSALLMALFPASLTALVIGCAGLGFFLATIFPTTMTLAGRSMAITGKVTSVFSVGSSLGALLVPWLVGQFFEPVGPQVLTSLLLVVLSLTLGVFVLLDRRLKLALQQS